MSKTTTALIAKLALTFVAAWLTLGFIDGNPIGLILGIALAGTIINYFVGDLMILPKMGNIIASIGDGIMAAIVAYIILAIFFPAATISVTSLMLFAVLVAIAEYFFHMYLNKSEEVAP